MRQLFTNFMTSKRFRRFFLLAVVFAFVFYAGYDRWTNSQYYVYGEHLSDVAVTVDGIPLTMEDMAYYILYEECVVEKQARIYNPTSTKDYWNIRDDGYIMSAVVKKTILGMAVHDEIFYQAAIENGVTLTEEEEAYIENRIADFWMDLLDEQLENLPVEEEVVNKQIRKSALAQKYQGILASEMEIASVRLDWDGYDFEEILEEHKVRKNQRNWSRLRISEVTIHHSSVNYINGQ